MSTRRILCLFTALVSALLLWGCDRQEKPEQTQTTVPVETTLPKYTVTFYTGDQVYLEAQVEAGGFVTVAEPQVKGLKFYGWLDAKGNPADPEAAAVGKNVKYYACLYPDLTAHEPYLFADKNRFLHPDEAMTGEALAIAVNMLAAPGAEAYLPELPEGETPVTGKELGVLLEQMFPETLLTELPASDETVTRAGFAALMNRLLGRTQTAVTVAENAVLPVDVAPGREDAAALLEACFHHTHPDTGAGWAETAENLKHPAGFFNVDGWLYCVGEDGALVKDSQVGVLTFGADGRYTCGDGELDVLVAEILAQIIADNPGAERIDLLRRAFEYSRDSFSYLRRNAYYFGQTGWEIEDAKKMITTKRGNCYSYAAVFWALGRGLGYETIGISGTMTKTDQPHSWVEIFFDGVPYVFDPEMEMVYRFERDIFDKDMFMVDYERGKYWNYKRP